MPKEDNVEKRKARLEWCLSSTAVSPYRPGTQDVNYFIEEVCFL